MNLLLSLLSFFSAQLTNYPGEIETDVLSAYSTKTYPICDFNNDGIVDHLSHQLLNGHATLAIVSGLDNQVLFERPATDPSLFYLEYAAGFDLNGDGIGDWISIEYPIVDLAVRIELIAIFSGADGSEFATIDGSIVGDQYRWAYVISDVDGDGWLDFVVNKSNPIQATGTTIIVSSQTGLEIADFGQFIQAKNIGDVNGDGQMEIAELNSQNLLSIYSCGNQQLLYSIDLTLHNDPSLDFSASSLTALGDVNGDGYNDFLIGQSWAYLWWEPWIFDPPSVLCLSGIDGSLIYKAKVDNELESLLLGAEYPDFGNDLANVGDINGDSINDFLVYIQTFYVTWGRHQGVVPTAFLFSGATGDLINITHGLWPGWQWTTYLTGTENINIDQGFFLNSYDVSSWHRSFNTYSPYISADTTSISSAAGGDINYSIDFPDSQANNTYKILVSSFTNRKFFTRNSMYIPLQFSDMLVHYYINGQFGSAGSLGGVLDINGNASGTFSFAPGALVNMVDRTYAYCAVSYDGNGVNQLVSTKLPIEVTQ
jgi:hypothetical protein